jgi:hypothetical protein
VQGSVASHVQASADQVKDQAGQAAHEAKPWVTRLGRLGFAAKGVVYVIVGLLAAQAALGMGGTTTDTRGVFDWVVQAPFGRLLLAVMGIGLAGYALWRFVQAGLDTEHKGTDLSGLYTRGAYVVIGIVYCGLTLSAIRLSLGSDEGGGQSTQSSTAWLLSQPFGQWLVGIVGVMVIGAGLFQAYRAYTAKFCEKLDLHEMTRDQIDMVTRIGRLGFAARGVVFAIIGGFLLVAARHAEPEQARGLGGALATIAEQPSGPWLLATVAIGLIAYGAFMLVEARYRRMVIT